MRASQAGPGIGTLVALVAVTWCATAFADDGAVERRIQAIKAPSTQLKWQRIPWSTDLAESQRLARQERRPILLWVSGDDPLERC